MKKTILLFLFSFTLVYSLSPYRVIQKIRSKNKYILKNISHKNFLRVHTYKNQEFYIARFIKQRALRSLLGGLKNKSYKVRMLIASNLYQLKMTSIHKRLIQKYYLEEKDMGVKLALQDILVQIDSDRFKKALRRSDSSFLGKIKFNDIVDLFDKGYPGEKKGFSKKHIQFLKAGLFNTDEKIQSYSVQMLGRVKSGKHLAKKILKKYLRKMKSKSLKKETNTSLKCLKNSKSCPDVVINQYE